MNHTEQTNLNWMLDLANNKELWNLLTDKSSCYHPSSIVFEYNTLKEAIENKNVYGSLLLIRDVYESIMKIPVLMGLIILDKKSKEADAANQDFTSAYNEILNNLLTNALSMGSWNSLISILIKKKSTFSLPNTLYQILRKTRTLCTQKICTGVSDVINWRNNTIGHGKCRLADDESYQMEVEMLLQHLSDYFQQTKTLYQNCFFEQNGVKLCGNQFTHNDTNPILLHIEDSVYTTDEYIHNHPSGCYFFDTFYSRKKTEKHIDYIAGKEQLVKNGYFNDLYKNISRNTSPLLSGKLVTRESDRILAELNTPSNYIEPEFLITQIKAAMEKINKGIITIFMERGMGKSALINKLDGMYQEQELIEQAVIRCYYASNGQIRGLYDFIGSFNNAFCNGPIYDNHLRESSEHIKQLSADSAAPDKDMAEIIQTYYDYYFNQGADYLIYCIDGIDELTEKNKSILNFLPTSDMLEDGQFIILTSRLDTEDTLGTLCKENIDLVKSKSDFIIEVKRTNENYQALLTDYIKKELKISDTSTITAILASVDYRFLYLKVYLALKANDSDKTLDSSNAHSVMASYMDYLLSAYGIKIGQKLKLLCAIIAIFKEVSIQELCEYITYETINMLTIGCMNDLLPLLVTTRKKGINYYKFANVEYETYVLNNYEKECLLVLESFMNSLNCHLEEKNLNKQDLLFLTNGFLSFSGMADVYPSLKKALYTPKNIKIIVTLSDSIENYRFSQGLLEKAAAQFLDAAFSLFLYCADMDLEADIHSLPEPNANLAFTPVAVSNPNLNHWISYHKDFESLLIKIEQIIRNTNNNNAAWHHFLFPPIFHESEFCEKIGSEGVNRRMSWYIESGKGELLFKEFIPVIFTPDKEGDIYPGSYTLYFEFNNTLKDADLKNLQENIFALIFLSSNEPADFQRGIKIIHKLLENNYPFEIFEEFQQVCPKELQLSKEEILNDSYFTKKILYPVTIYCDLPETLTFSQKQNLSDCLFRSLWFLESNMCDKNLYTELLSLLEKFHNQLFEKIKKIIQDGYNIEKRIDRLLPYRNYLLFMLGAIFHDNEFSSKMMEWTDLLYPYLDWEGRCTKEIVEALLLEISVLKQDDSYIPHPKYSEMRIRYNKEQLFQCTEFTLILLCHYHKNGDISKVNALIADINASEMSWSMESKYLYIKYLLGIENSCKKELFDLKDKIYSQIILELKNYDTYTDFLEFKNILYDYLEIFYHTKHYSDGIEACEEIKSLFSSICNPTIQSYEEYFQMLSEHLECIKTFFMFLDAGEISPLIIHPDLFDDAFRKDYIDEFYYKIINFISEIQKHTSIKRESYEWNRLIFSIPKGAASMPKWYPLPERTTK